MPVDNNRKHVLIRYQADDDNFYAFQTTYNHAQAIGAVAALTSDPPFPKKWKPRVLHGIITKAGRDQKTSIVVDKTTGTLWKQHAGTILLNPYGTFRITGRTGERRTQGAVDFNGVQNPQNEMVRVGYAGDDGTAYFLVMSRRHAYAGGCGAPSAGAIGFPKRWTPRHWNAINPDLTGADQHAVVICPDPNQAGWTTNATINLNLGTLGTFNSTGRTAEKRPESAPPYAP